MSDLCILEFEASRSVSVSSIITALLFAIESILLLLCCYNLSGPDPAILVDGTLFHPAASICFFIPIQIFIYLASL